MSEQRCQMTGCTNPFDVASPDAHWPNGETLRQRGMRLTGCCDRHFVDLAKYQFDWPWPSLSTDEQFEYLRKNGEGVPSWMLLAESRP